MNWIRPSESPKTLGSPVPYVAVVAAVSGAALILAAGGESARLALRYERELMTTEIWRVISAHLVHLGPGHVAMNLVAFVIMAAIFYPFLSVARMLSTLLTAAVGISCGFFFFFPDVEWYVGLSGVLHGLMLVGSWVWLKAGERLAAVLILGLVAKLVIEAVGGPLPLAETAAAGPVLTQSHWLGALVSVPCLWGVGRRS